MNILDQSLIVKYDEDASPAFYILKEKTKLSDVFDRLPAGIINKNITGIGATTLEIGSPRHSIIVVPLRSIAYSKANEHHHCKYVGGKTKYMRLTTPAEIKNYHKKQNIQYKKFLVVADSLPKLMKALGEEAYKYFIMIDEIDSFQLDSKFRDSMENCLDYYKTFPKDQRALVSSTIMEFSDPELLDERKYLFNYDKHVPRKIDLFYSENVKGAAYDFIVELCKNNPQDKILVAYNTVDGCKAIATKLVEECQVPFEEIKILCSPKRKDDVPLFYDELESGILKGRINFMTSAYFVGVDINESYHSIAICVPDLIHTLLSTNRLKQIAGRCRKENLLSETIFYKPTHFSSEDQIPKEVLLESATKKIKAIDCITNNFENDKILTKQILDVRELIIGKSDVYEYSLTRVNINDVLTFSYFNLDACLETMNTAKVLYSDSYALYFALSKDNNEVSNELIESSTSVSMKLQVDKALHQEQVINALEAIRNLDDPQKIFNLINTTGTGVQTKIYTRYQELHKYFDDKEELLSYLVDLSTQNETAYKSFMTGIKFKNDDSHLKKIILDSFSFGSIYNSNEIMEKLNNAFALAGLHTKIETPETAVKKLRQYFNTKKDKRKIKDGLPTHEILGFYEPKYIIRKRIRNNNKINSKINVVAVDN